MPKAGSGVAVIGSMLSPVRGWSKNFPRGARFSTFSGGGTFDHARREAKRRRAAAVADPVAVPGDSARGHGAAVPQRVLGQPLRRHLRGRRLGRTAVQLARQVRVGHRVAELHAAARGRERPAEDRPLALHGADRGPVGPCRFAPGAPVRRRPGTDGVALLHQLRRVAFHSGRAPAGRRLRAVLAAVPDHAALIPVQRFGAPARWAGRRCRMAPRWYAVCVMAPIATPSASSSHTACVSTATSRRSYSSRSRARKAAHAAASTADTVQLRLRSREVDSPRSPRIDSATLEVRWWTWPAIVVWPGPPLWEASAALNPLIVPKTPVPGDVSVK